MRKVALFGEDAFHEAFLTPLLKRLGQEYNIPVEVHSISVRRGLTKAHYEFKEFLGDLQRDRLYLPDMILVAVDANCKGYADRRRLFEKLLTKYPQFEYLMVYAIPEPHIERWMLVDQNAFRAVLGRGCTLPAVKCRRQHYKELLNREIVDSGVKPRLGGREYAEDIVNVLDLAHVEITEPSFGRLIGNLRDFFNRWRQQAD